MKKLIIFLTASIVCNACITYKPLPTINQTEKNDTLNWINQIELGKKYKFKLDDGKVVVMKVERVSGDSVSGKAKVRYKDTAGQWHNWEDWNTPVNPFHVLYVREAKFNAGLTLLAITPIIVFAIAALTFNPTVSVF